MHHFSVTELPAKAPVYGALIGLLNASNHEVTGKLMEEFNKTLEQTIVDTNWFKLKQFLRFYAELVNANVILPTTFCNLLNDLLSVMDQPNQLCQRLDCVVYIILATIPWCGKELSERCPADLDQIFKKIEIYMQRRGDKPVLDILKQYNGIQYDSAKEDVSLTRSKRKVELMADFVVYIAFGTYLDTCSGSSKQIMGCKFIFDVYVGDTANSSLLLVAFLPQALQMVR